jgi:hypothetical protein
MGTGFSKCLARHLYVKIVTFHRCPKCNDSCNCRFCRKAKGLEPTGSVNSSLNSPIKLNEVSYRNLNLKARQAEKAAAAASAVKSEVCDVTRDGFLKLGSVASGRDVRPVICL